jgi:hypothetical protein
MKFGNFQYSKDEWFLVKLLTLSLWILPVIKVIGRYQSIPFPEGLCLFFDFTFVIQPPFSFIVILCAIAFSVLYLFERSMIITTLSLALISVVVFSIERSNGIFHRKELLSVVFIVQSVAYVRYYLGSKNLKSQTTATNLAMKYSVQAIAAGYMIAGITKLQNSGIGWITESPNMVVQIIKSFSQKSIDTQFAFLFDYGKYMSDMLIQYPNFIKVAFTAALLIELFAFIAMLGKRSARTYGFVLLTLHIAMLAMMGIVLAAFVGLLFIYLINIPGFVINLFNRLKRNRQIGN